MIAIDIHKKLRAGHGQADLRVKLQADKGSITIIHGPSGAGKTTLLKIIAGLTKADSGNVVVNDQVWLDTTASVNLPPQQRKTGFVFQNYALFPNMTVQQHLEYATNNSRWIDQLLKLGALDGLADRKPDYLSGGQQQRLAILRAMANQPSLLLMDEPFSALDKKTKTGLIAGLKMLWDELGTTVIIVSHDQQELTGIATGDLYIES